MILVQNFLVILSILSYQSVVQAEETIQTTNNLPKIHREKRHEIYLREQINDVGYEIKLLLKQFADKVDTRLTSLENSIRALKDVNAGEPTSTKNESAYSSGDTMMSDESHCKQIVGHSEFIRADEVESPEDLFVAGKDVNGSPYFICRMFLVDNFKYDYFYGAATRDTCWIVGKDQAYAEKRTGVFSLMRKPRSAKYEWRFPYRYLPSQENNKVIDFTSFGYEVNRNATSVGFESFDGPERYVGHCFKEESVIPGMITKTQGLSIASSTWWSTSSEVCRNFQVLVCKH